MSKVSSSILSLTLAAALLCTSCSDDTPGENSIDANPVIIDGIKATMGSGSDSRADVPLNDPDYIGRKDFTDGDNLVFTTIKRTDNPIAIYSYEGILWERHGDSWVRGNDDKAKKIYWSDALNGHTFTGYSKPAMPADQTFAWEAKGDYYYGHLGNFTNSSADVIDYTSKFAADGVTIAAADSGSIKLRRDDIVLTHNPALKAQPGGSIALVEFRHALSNILIVVNINGFAASNDAEDTESIVSDMLLANQPVNYKWDKKSNKAEPLDASDKSNVSNWSETKTLKACIFSPKGKNTGRYKQFIFSTLAVPTTDAGRDMTFTFDVTYPDPLRPNTAKITKTYTASLTKVILYAGKRTQINITLEHTNEKMTVGAEYINWEFVSTPDESNLVKKSTFLTSTDRNHVTIHTDPKATEDDATWLYYKRDTNGDIQKDANDNDIILDVYGNDGTEEKPYIIATADQLLSFAYEVKGTGGGGAEFDFSGKCVKLDAAITMQPKLTTQATDANAVHWIGIGDNEGDNGHVFNGKFLGYSRQLSGLLGKPLFIKTGKDAFVEHISLKNVLRVDGGGAAVETNGGILGACIIEGDVIYSSTTGTETYCGSLAAVNTGHILSCVHIGKVQGPDYVGGLVGLNKGHIVASYHTGYVISDSRDNSKVYGTAKSDNGKVFGIYFNSVYLPGTNESGAQSTSDLQSESFVTEINVCKLNYINEGTASTGLSEQMLQHYKDEHNFQYRPGAYPLPD